MNFLCSGAVRSPPPCWRPLVVPMPLAAQSRHLLEYRPITSPVVGTRRMAVIPNAIASEVGARILRYGGKLVDAAIQWGSLLRSCCRVPALLAAMDP